MRVTRSRALIALTPAVVLFGTGTHQAGAVPGTSAGHTYALSTPSAINGDYFGQSVGISGRTAVVGAPYTDGQHGAAYVYTRPAGGWRAMTAPTATLTIPGTNSPDFGYFVAIDGRTIVVGADNQSVSGVGSGAAYVFVEPKDGWHTTNHPTAALTPPDPTSPDDFGEMLAISGSTIVVGAPDHATGGHAFAGAAYVYTRPSTGWKSTSHGFELTSSAPSADEYFSEFVAASGPTVVIGAFGHSEPSKSEIGMAYVFEKPASGGWKKHTESARLLGADSAADDEFGESVAVSGATIAVGAASKSVEGVSSGAVYIFHAPKSGWAPGLHTSSIELTPSQPSSGDNFGEALSMSGSMLAVGSTEATATYPDAGLAYVFLEPSKGWASTNKSLVVSDPIPGKNHYFGVVAIDSGVLVVASLEGGTLGQGSADVFAKSAPTLRGVAQSRTHWSPGSHPIAVNPRHHKHGGSVFRFTTDQPATVSLSFSERKHGHWRHQGTVSLAAKVGTTKVYVDGPLGSGHKLKSGKCRVAITGSNNNGASTTKTLRFTVT